MNSRIKMAELVTVNGKKFRKFLSEEEIEERIGELGHQISVDFPHGVLLIGVLKGSYIFLSDLVRSISSPTQIDFVKISSYGGDMTSSGRIEYQLDLSCDIAARDVLVVEDIVDTGNTLSDLVSSLKNRKPRTLSVATLLHKPDATKHSLELNYVGFKIPNRFVVGYGMDFAEFGRELRQIYCLDESEK